MSKKKEYGISRKKVQNLLFSDDITKMDVLKGFINRNIDDTRYASRVVLNTVQSFFDAKEANTKVKAVKGSYTNQMRMNMKLDKNRDESYAHHAVDAMLIGFSQLGYEAYRKLQGEFIDFESGEILNQGMWEEKMSDDVYADYLYGMKWSNIRHEITRAEKEVKYWHYVDYKANRGFAIRRFAEQGSMMERHIKSINSTFEQKKVRQFSKNLHLAKRKVTEKNCWFIKMTEEHSTTLFRF